MPNPTQPAPAHDPNHEPDLNAAVQRVLAEVDAVREDDLEPHNREISSVIPMVLGGFQRAQPFLAQLATLPTLDVARIRKLGDYVDSLIYWSAGASYAVTATPEITAMVERALTIREHTIHDLGSLVRHGYIPGALVENFGGSVAHREIALDLVGLSKLVHERFADIEGRSPITLAAMDDAASLGHDILKVLGEKTGAQAQLARDVVRRNKAYTLVVRVYGELRDALLFLRRVEGDADAIVPSLYSGRKSPKKGADDAEGASTSGTTSTAPATNAAPRSSLIVPD